MPAYHGMVSSQSMNRFLCAATPSAPSAVCTARKSASISAALKIPSAVAPATGRRASHGSQARRVRYSRSVYPPLAAIEMTRVRLRGVRSERSETPSATRAQAMPAMTSQRSQRGELRIALWRGYRGRSRSWKTRLPTVPRWPWYLPA